MQTANHVLTHLNLPFSRFKIFVDRIVITYGVAVENLHTPRRHFQPFWQNEIFSRRQQEMTVVLHPAVELLLLYWIVVHY